MKGTALQTRRIGIGIALFGLAIAIFFTVPMVSEWRVVDSATAISWGVALVSIGIAVYAIGISKGSDERMQAMANLEFYEKMAMVQQYTVDLSQPDTDQWNKAYANKIFYDLKGAKQLEEWVKDPEIAKMLHDGIQTLIDQALAGQKHEHLIKRLQETKKDF